MKNHYSLFFILFIISPIITTSDQEILTIRTDECPNGHAHVADDFDCHDFYHCTGDSNHRVITMVKKSCGKFLMFHPLTQNCDWPFRVWRLRPECNYVPRPIKKLQSGRPLKPSRFRVFPKPSFLYQSYPKTELPIYYLSPVQARARTKLQPIAIKIRENRAELTTASPPSTYPPTTTTKTTVPTTTKITVSTTNKTTVSTTTKTTVSTTTKTTVSTTTETPLPTTTITPPKRSATPKIITTTAKATTTKKKTTTRLIASKPMIISTSPATTSRPSRSTTFTTTIFFEELESGQAAPLLTSKLIPHGRFNLDTLRVFTPKNVTQLKKAHPKKLNSWKDRSSLWNQFRFSPSKMVSVKILK